MYIIRYSVLVLNCFMLGRFACFNSKTGDTEDILRDAALTMLLNVIACVAQILFA